MMPYIFKQIGNCKNKLEPVLGGGGEGGVTFSGWEKHVA